MWVGSATDSFTEKRLKDRVRFISGVFAFFFGLLVLRLYYLQVLKGESFAQVSESNRTNTIFLAAPRGNFYDWKGKVLVSNRPSWSLMYSVSDKTLIEKENVFSRLRPFLAPFPGKWESRLQKAFKTKQIVRLAEDVPKEVAFGMREMGELLPGLRMEMEFRRSYPDGFQAPQLIGYISEVNEKELRDDSWFSRKPGDLIGKMGLERIFDDQLRGRDGGMLIEVDSVGRLKKILRELPYERGSTVQLTLDRQLQRIAQDELEKTPTGRGAVVALDSETGAVRVWASAPTFDPSDSLADDVKNPDLPFFDRVYRGAYPPGSLFKIVTAIAGLKEGAIRKKQKIYCPGFVTLQGRGGKERKYRCWKAHGNVDFWKAISESCDTFFYLLSEKIGSGPMHETGRDFLLDQRVQDSLPFENRGTLPNPSWKRKRGLGGWSTGDNYNMSIGQGYVTSTPLQMAVMMEGVFNRGNIFKPYLIEKVIDSNGLVTQEGAPIRVQVVNLKEQIWDDILEATRQVVDGGTGAASRVPGVVVYGKTGTAQNPHGEDHAWFLAAARYPDEQKGLIICVFVENGGGGGAIAAPIARKLIQAAFPPKEGPPSV